MDRNIPSYSYLGLMSDRENQTYREPISMYRSDDRDVTLVRIKESRPGLDIGSLARSLARVFTPKIVDDVRESGMREEDDP